MTRLLPLFLALLAAPAWGGECEGPTNCGLDEVVVPDFSLVDQNTASPTLGQTFTQDEFLGSVLVIYWASAT